MKRLPGPNLNTNDRIVDRPEWVDIESLSSLRVSPGVGEIIELVNTRKDFFFAEKNIDW
jgi:hypothetical protein